MPSAEEFAANYSSFWRNALPMAEGFMRSANLGPERYAVPLESIAPRERHAFIAEAAFSEFRRGRTSRDSQRVSDASVDEARTHVANIVGEPATSMPWLTSAESREAKFIAERIEEFIRLRGAAAVQIDPSFPGCGMIERSTGDIRLDDHLVEIKSVGRTFRLLDLRQILTYAALNHAAGLGDFTSIILCNPRSGTFLEWAPDVVCYQIAGLPAGELYDSIVRFASEFEPYGL